MLHANEACIHTRNIAKELQILKSNLIHLHVVHLPVLVLEEVVTAHDEQRQVVVQSVRRLHHCQTICTNAT